MKQVYLSGGIQDFTEKEKHLWRETAKSLLKCPTLDPTRAPAGPKVVELDKSDIDQSTHVLVYFIRPSVGTSMEIIYSWEKKKKVYVVIDPSVDMKLLSPWLVYHSSRIFKTIEEAVEQINTD